MPSINKIILFINLCILLAVTMQILKQKKLVQENRQIKEDIEELVQENSRIVEVILSNENIMTLIKY